MKTRVPDYFDQFHCLAGACPDTCCGQWEIVVDEAAKERYLSVKGPLGEQIKNALTTVDGEDCMALVDGKCPLLTKDGLCPIVTELGEDFLSTTCHTHPRFTEIYGGLQETMLSISCPEAARLLLERQEPLTFLTRTDDTPPEPNDLDGDLFHLVETSRETAFALVQNRNLPLSDRLALLLCFAQRLEHTMDLPNACYELCDLYRDPSYQFRQLRRIRRLRRNGTMTFIRQLLTVMEHLTDQLPDCLDKLERPDLTPWEIPLEQLTMYFLFRWWMKIACNGFFWRQAAATVVSVLTVASLASVTGDVIESARLYSKEVEHSDDNMNLLRHAMELPQFSRTELLKLLEVPHAI